MFAQPSVPEGTGCEGPGLTPGGERSVHRDPRPGMITRWLVDNTPGLYPAPTLGSLPLNARNMVQGRQVLTVRAWDATGVFLDERPPHEGAVRLGEWNVPRMPIR